MSETTSAPWESDPIVAPASPPWASDPVVTAAPEAQHPVAGPSGDLSVDIPRRLASAGTDALGGLLSLPRTVAQGVDWLYNKAGVPVHSDEKLASYTVPDGEGNPSPLFPDAATAREMAYKTTGATEYAPETALGRYTQAGLAAAPLGAASGVRAIIPSIVGGGAGEAAAEVVPEHPLISRLLGFTFGAHTASAVANGAAKTLGATTGLAPTSELYQAFDRQGVDKSLTGDVTQNPALQRTQSLAAKMPGGEELVRDSGEKAINDWQAAAERTASQLGPSATHAEAGRALQQAAGQWLQDFKQQSADKWDAFRNAVPATTPVKVNGFENALQSVNQDFGGADALAKVLQPSLGAKLKDALAADVSPNGTLPWQAVQATRTRLGEMLEGGQLGDNDIARTAVKRLYSSLSDDMRDGASAAGPTAAKAFNQANAYTAYGHTLLDDHLAPILNATEPGKAAQYALAQVRQGAARLGAIENAMPGQPANLGATILREAAAPDAASGRVNPGALPTALKGISPAARPFLFNAPQPVPPAVQGPNGLMLSPPPSGPNPGMQGVNDLNLIAQAQRNTIKSTGNNSNSAAHYATGMGRLMALPEFVHQGYEMGGVPGAVAGGVGGYFAPNIVGAGSRAFAVNPLLSRIYSTELEPFSAPAMTTPNTLLQSTAPDRRYLPGAASNPLLSGPRVIGNAATPPRR